MKRFLLSIGLSLVFLGTSFGQTTVSYDFAASGAVSGLNESSPGISLDTNIGFGSFKNDGTSNPGIFSSQLRLYQNATKGGSIIIYANNGATITDIVINASGTTGPAGYTVDGGSQVNLSAGTTYSITGITASSQVEFFQRDASSSNRIYVDSFSVTYTSSSSSDPEPTNHPTSFTATADGFSEIDLSWTDATGSQLPAGYLIKASSTSLAAISNPTDTNAESDDSDLSDGSGVLNITQGTQAASFSGLNDNTQYFFKIYSYTNSGSNIDYKTDGTIQSDDATTAEFDSDLIISQYVESGSIKGIEIWNASESTIDFSTKTLVVRRYANGSSSPTTEATINTGTLASDAVLVIGGSTLSSYMSANLPSVTFLNDGFSYNGDDALDITLDGAVQDVFGTIGTDPGTEWTGNDVSTEDQNIELKSGVTAGTSSGFSDPSTRFQTVDNSISGTEDLRGFGLAPGDILITGDAGWRLLSLPKTGGTVADVSDDSPVQGIANGDDSGATTNLILYQSGNSFTKPTNVSTPWGDGFGFGLYFYNNTTNGSSTLPVTLDVTGSEPSSNVVVNLNTTASGSTGGSGASDSKYTLVGNPFASNFDLSSFTVSAGTGIQDNVHFWNDGAGSYSAIDRTSTSGYVVAPWQGFWVEVLSSQSATQITFPSSGKTTSSVDGTFFSKQVNNRGDISFTLSSDNSYDEAIRLAFREYATTAMDNADASKFTPLIPNYATMAFASNNRLKSVESLPYNLEEEVTLSLQPQVVGVSGEFTFGWNGLETIPGEWELILHDYDTGENIDMRAASEYVFTAGAQAKANPNPLSLLSGPTAVAMKAKAEANRFGITIRPTSVSNETEDSPAAFALEQNYPNPFNPSTTISYSVQEAGAVTISVYNLMGQKVATLVDETKAAGQYNVRWNAAGAASGMYYYRLEAGGQSITRKMTLIK